MGVKKDIEKLQGTWNIVSLEMGGQKYPSVGSQISIEGTKFTSLNMGAEYSGTMTVNESTRPRRFDVLFETGPEEGNRSMGIYELDGDTWKICLGLTGQTRPTEFATTPDSGHALEVLKRAAGGAKIEIPASAENAEPVAELEGDWFMVSCRQNGQPMDPRFVSIAKREFSATATTLTVGGQPYMKSQFRADATRKTIEYADLRQHGIYKVTGDTLHTCLVAEGETRPADFTSVAGDGRLVSEWSRQKPAAQTQARSRAASAGE